jgi:hypothetical protein
MFLTLNWKKIVLFSLKVDDQIVRIPYILQMLLQIILIQFIVQLLPSLLILFRQTFYSQLLFLLLKLVKP